MIITGLATLTNGRLIIFLLYSLCYNSRSSISHLLAPSCATFLGTPLGFGPQSYGMDLNTSHPFTPILNVSCRLSVTALTQEEDRWRTRLN
jgi:hypothetical protein